MVTVARRRGGGRLGDASLRADGRILGVLVLAVGVAAGGYWLGSDTVRYHLAADTSGPLRVSFWGSYQEFGMWKRMLASFREKHPDIPVKMEYVTTRYEAKMRQLFVAGAAPDVMLYQDEPFPALIQRVVDAATGKTLVEPQFLDLTAFADQRGEDLRLKRFYDSAVRCFGRWEGTGPRRRWHQYGLPVWGGCNLIFYNKRRFAACGVRVGTIPPALRRYVVEAGLARDPAGGYVLDDERWTIKEFVQLCRYLTRDHDADGRIDQFGFSTTFWLYWLPWHVTLGARYLSEDLTRLALMGPEAEASLQLWQDLYIKYHVIPRAAEMGQMNQSVGFMTGRIAMFCTGPWGMPFLDQANVPYDLLHIPRRRPGGFRATRVTWDCVAIYARSRKKDQAWALVKHLVSPRAQRIVAEAQRSIPALRSVGAYFAMRKPGVAVGKFLRAAETYAVMQPITVHWDLMARKMSELFGLLRAPDQRDRLSVHEALGRLYSDTELTEKFPPADERLAEQYRRAWKARRSR